MAHINYLSVNGEILVLLRQAKRLARRYRDLTGKPLGVTGEVAELEAARLLGLRLAPARQAGFDAVERGGDKARRLQIKGRCLREDGKRGQRVGSINVEQGWDAVLLVLLDEDFDAVEIHEAKRAKVLSTLKGSPRSDMSVEKFKSIGRLRYPKATARAR